MYDVVQVGDVGFIRRGYFHCLFSVLLSGDHLSPIETLVSRNIISHYDPRLQIISIRVQKTQATSARGMLACLVNVTYML
ncbi:hypothetical protein BC827DRAFT_384731 [Russula dissimulans]|nr:hypothetical protein BC827DRAFT_384731 [Russula dissimulans]